METQNEMLKTLSEKQMELNKQKQKIQNELDKIYNTLDDISSTYFVNKAKDFILKCEGKKWISDTSGTYFCVLDSVFSDDKSSVNFFGICIDIYKDGNVSIDSYKTLSFNSVEDITSWVIATEDEVKIELLKAYTTQVDLVMKKKRGT